MKAVVQALITILLVAIMTSAVRWYAEEKDYLETLLNITLVILIQDILFGKRK